MSNQLVVAAPGGVGGVEELVGQVAAGGAHDFDEMVGGIARRHLVHEEGGPFQAAGFRTSWPCRA